MDALSSNIPHLSSIDTLQFANKRKTSEVMPSANGSEQASAVSANADAATLKNVPEPGASRDSTSDKGQNQNGKDTQNKPKELQDAVDNANRFFEQVSRELRFQRSETTDTLVVQIVDQKTGEVIRQVPSEEMLKISKELEKISGLLFKGKA